MQTREMVNAVSREYSDIELDRDAGDDSTQIIVAAYCLYLHNCLVRVKVNYELVLDTFFFSSYFFFV